MTRRDFLLGVTLLPALARLQPVAGGTRLGTIPFGRPGAQTAPLNRLLGDGLDARQFIDLSSLSADTLVTPADRFFVRTAPGPTLPRAEGWTISLGGLAQEKATLDVPALERLGRAS